MNYLLGNIILPAQITYGRPVRRMNRAEGFLTIMEAVAISEASNCISFGFALCPVFL
jgi:hypothetical protein